MNKVKKSRLSATQKDALFILAMFIDKGKTAHVPAAVIKKMIDISKASPLDHSNYLKGVHTLGRNGYLDVVKMRNDSVGIKLSNDGFAIAAKLFESRMGYALSMASDSEQLDLVSFIENN